MLSKISMRVRVLALRMSRLRKLLILRLVWAIALVSLLLAGSIYAVANVFISNEAESSALSGNATAVTDTSASGASAVKFGSAPSATWPDATNTGVAGCPALQQVSTVSDGYQVNLNQDGMVYENKEIMNETVLRVRANNVTIRCVKMHGIGWYGIDNTEISTVTGTVVDKVEVDCQDKGFVVGLLLHDVIVTRVNVHHCDHMMNSGGDNVSISDSYCHDLTDLPGVHADCFQNLSGNTNVQILHNSFWGWDTSDVLLGQEYGEASNIVVDGNRFLSDPNKTPPAYLLYNSGTNTIVRNNFFTTRYTYGHCTDNKAPGSTLTWTNNRWWENNAVISGC